MFNQCSYFAGPERNRELCDEGKQMDSAETDWLLAAKQAVQHLPPEGSDVLCFHGPLDPASSR